MRKLLIFVLLFFLAERDEARNLDSLVKSFHQTFETQTNRDFATDTAFFVQAQWIAEGFYDKNDLFNAFKYNRIAQQFYEKICHETYPLPVGSGDFLKRALFDYAWLQISILEKKESYNEALDLAFSLLKHLENTNDKKRLAKIEQEIGFIYYLFGNYNKALEFYLKAVDLLKTTNDLLKIGSAYNDLYGIYAAMGDQTTAIKYCFSALSCFRKIGHTRGMRAAYGNLALYYQRLNVDKALSYALQSRSLRSDTVDVENAGLDESTLGALYFTKSQQEKHSSLKKRYLELSESAFNRGLQIARLLPNKSALRDCLAGLASVEKEKKNFEAAFAYMVLSNAYKDSLLSEENKAASISSLLKYEFNKKQREQQLLNEKKEAVKQKELEKQKLQKYFFICGFILVSVLAAFVFRGFKSKQKAHRIITLQKNEVEKQKNMVEQKQSQLLHSINYARRIQNNLLKSEEELLSILPHSFILFKPRDIVSGDFYWFTQTPSKDLIMILGDCTGHGVPGALLSMIGITAINEIVNHQQVHDPGDILYRLSNDMHEAFSKDRQMNKTDGMDLTVCRVSFSEKKFYFAGVNQGMYSHSKHTGLVKMEAQISSINGIFDIQPGEKVPTACSDIYEDSCFYLFTDGIIDQIGEESGKKFLTRRFEELVLRYSGTEMARQKQQMILELERWQGDNRQIDDITVIGFAAGV